MLWEGLNLMLIGMGTVFVFLTLLVFCTKLMSRLIAHYFPEVIKPPLAPPNPNGQRQEEIIAAVSAAVHHHRQRH